VGTGLWEFFPVIYSPVSVFCVPIWAPILTFCTFAALSRAQNDPLTISRAFTALATLTLVLQPLATIIVSLPVIAGAIISSQRVQDFLNAKEYNHSDNNTKPLPDEGLNSPMMDKMNAGKDHDKQNIAVVHGKFSWSNDTEHTIDIVNLNIRRQQLTMVLGPVGCGKSTLLKLLLGELSSFEGFIHTNYSGVAFCDQTPWVPNETIREVIIGGGDIDENWYDTVLAACSLNQDISNWPSGDKTSVGTKGISISGGQKHRIVGVIQF
jgi:ATP-binding cassette, subfamily C (CFTR/MRP), member 1